MTDAERLDKLQSLGAFDVRVDADGVFWLTVWRDGSAWDGDSLRECIDSLPAAESEVQK